MKINTKIVVVLISILVEFIASSAFSETLLDLSKEPKNFRGLEWGQRIPWGKRLFEFYSVKGDGEKTYRRRKEKLYFGAAKLDFVLYVLPDNKFISSLMIAKNENAGTLFREAINQYGPSSRYITSGDFSLHQWFFQTVEVIASLNYKINEAGI